SGGDPELLRLSRLGPISPETEADFPPRPRRVGPRKARGPRYFPLKGAKDRYILFPASFRLVLKSHPRRAIDIYSRLGGWGRSGRAKSSKLCKAIARRPALRSRSTRICSAIRC